MLHIEAPADARGRNYPGPRPSAHSAHALREQKLTEGSAPVKRVNGER